MAYGNLHKLPKISDRLSYLYVEHARIDKEDQAIAINSDFGGTPVPCAGLALLMLGPGVSITHAAIVAAGYSPALGFVHIGKQLSFVYDIADLYKMETSVPAAFRTVASGVNDLEKRCRMACRDEFHQSNILKSIVADIHKLFDQDLSEFEDSDDYVNDPSAPGDLWNPNGEVSEGGLMYANAQQKEL